MRCVSLILAPVVALGRPRLWARLRRIVALEEGCPADVEAWCRQVRELAGLLDPPGVPGVQESMLDWMSDYLNLGPDPPHADDRSVLLRDALHEIVAESARLADALRTFAQKALERAEQGQLRLNLRSLLATRVRFRASDDYRSLYGRHADREIPFDHMPERTACTAVDPAGRVLVEQILRHFEHDPTIVLVLRLKAQGYSNRDIARETGLSISAVQRAMARVRAWLAGMETL